MPTFPTTQSPQLFIAEHGITWQGISLWSVWVICPGCVPHGPLSTRGWYAVGAEWEKEKALMLCNHYSAIAKTLVCHQHCFKLQPKTQHHRDCYEENYLHPSQP